MIALRMVLAQLFADPAAGTVVAGGVGVVLAKALSAPAKL